MCDLAVRRQLLQTGEATQANRPPSGALHSEATQANRPWQAASLCFAWLLFWPSCLSPASLGCSPSSCNACAVQRAMEAADCWRWPTLLPGASFWAAGLVGPPPHPLYDGVFCVVVCVCGGVWCGCYCDYYCSLRPVRLPVSMLGEAIETSERASSARRPALFPLALCPLGFGAAFFTEKVAALPGPLSPLHNYEDSSNLLTTARADDTKGGFPSAPSPG